jgi:hypothetical protein
MIGIEKSSRYTKVMGDYGEQVVRKWLARSGWEVSDSSDQNGLDIKASRKLATGGYVRLGITVKARTRWEKNKNESVYVFHPKSKRKQLLEACEVWGLEPWIAVYVEFDDHADLYLTSLDNYDRKYGDNKTVVDAWSITDNMRAEYTKDGKVKDVHIDFKATNWDWDDWGGWPEPEREAA